MHVMVDLETFGTAPGSVIASIGAVAFDPFGGTIGREFYCAISPASCHRAGLTFDADTVLWWLKQGDEARRALTTAATSLADALKAFELWWRFEGGLRLWGHGGNFDEPLLAAAYRAIGQRTPWQFSDARCTRTIYELADVRPDRTEGTHHNAVDDARAQAAAVIAAYAKLGLAGVAEIAVA